MSANFVHLHVHSEYSLLDGFGKPKNIIKKAKELGMSAIALTDHGNLYGAVEFYKAGKEEGINPIIGLEAYITNGDHTKKEKMETHHLILLAKNEVGYKNLMKLSSIAHLEGYYYRPKFNKEVLEKHKDGLIATSACIQGEVAQALIQDDYQKAKETCEWYQETFGDDYYLEIQRHEDEKFIPQAENEKIKEELEKMARYQKAIGTGVVKLSREFAIPIVATNDAHYIDKDDCEAQDVLVCVATGKVVTDVNRIRYIDTPTFYIRPQEEMEALFPDLPDAIKNTQKIADKCSIEISTIGRWFFPKYKLEAKTAEVEIEEKVYSKLEEKYPKASEEIKKRIGYELTTINNKGYAAYFLIVADIVEWANEQGIITNTRGSAAGSIVSYILGITTIDPIYYNLPFERFLNPFRPSPPDIDLDVSDDKREAVIEYMVKKYGREKVAQICTFGRMLSRGSVRDVARVLGLPYASGDRIAKLVPPPSQGFPVTIPKALELSPELKNLYQTDSEAKKILELSQKLEGSARHTSVHAAGVVISPTAITDFSPLQLEPSGEKIITQYEMHACEEVGLIKFDILGISNLSILGEAIKIVSKTRGVNLNYKSFPLDDKKTFGMLGHGETMGVFQMGSSGMTRYLKELKPNCIEDLMAMVALYRPGPLQVIPEYIQRKHDPSLVKYLDPRMEKFLDRSYGLIVYQDDLLFCAIELAGYNWEEADKFRKAVGKKIPGEMAAQKDKFIKGVLDNGQTQEFAEMLWKLFEPFQSYGFNKAHAASYGIVAYQTAYMKANYPVEFMCALLTAESGNLEKLAEGIVESRRMNINILTPDINKSSTGFEIEENQNSLEGRAIRFGFSGIKNVGNAAIGAVLTEREKNGNFKSFSDFLRRVDSRKVNKKVLESLIKSGALDNFGKRAALLFGMDDIRNKVAKVVSMENKDQTSLFEQQPEEQNTKDVQDNLPQIEEFSQEEKLSLEKELLGIYLTEHPLTNALVKLGGRVTHKLSQLSEDTDIGQNVKIGGVIASHRVVRTKNGGREMAFVEFEDETKSVPMVIFPNLYSKTKHYWVSRLPLLVDGRVEYREDALSIIVENVLTVKEALEKPQEEALNTATLFIPRGTASGVLIEINQLLQNNKGENDLIIRIENSFGEKKIKLPYSVAWTKSLENKIKSLL